MSPPVLHFSRGELREIGGNPGTWPSLALLGDPVAHSLSPRMHESALHDLGIEGSYRAIEVSRAELEAALRVAWDQGVRGLQLTLPHKEAVLPFCAEHAATVLRLGAANTLRRHKRGWEAHNTDLPGLVSALERSFPEAPWRGKCAVVGAGGAARACVAALEELGREACLVLARDPAKAEWARALGAEVAALEEPPLGELRLLLQATPLGLHPRDPSPIDASELPEGCAVMDLCYGSEPSRLLRDHAGRGPVADGRPLLLAQAALAFQLWYPGTAPHRALARGLES